MSRELAIPFTQIEEMLVNRDRALAVASEAAQKLAEAHAVFREAEEYARKASNGSKVYRSRDDGLSALHGGHFNVENTLKDYRVVVDSSVWTFLFDHAGIKSLMDAEEQRKFTTSIQSNEVPEATLDNVKATLETLLSSGDEIFLRGLARAFSKLDRRFKSHDGFKVGSRVIIDRLFDDNGHWNYGGRADDTFGDLERVFCLLDGKTSTRSIRQAVEESRGRGWQPRTSEVETEYFRVKTFKNGNAHLWFTRDDLVMKVNQKLAEYYGDVLPDATPKEADVFRNRSTAPAKNLAFYPTPRAACEAAFDIYFQEGDKILEPSAGLGGIIDYVYDQAAKQHRGKVNIQVDAIEIDADRAAILSRSVQRHQTCKVFQQNFLTNTLPESHYDYVLMNPPFEGTHWMDHVTKAWDHVKPGGKLIAILPVTAELGESKRHVAFRDWADNAIGRSRYNRLFTDLPPGSFRESGTNVNTVYLTMRKPN